MTEPKKMDLKSMDIPEDKKEQLRHLFPEVFTEKNIDFEKLKLTLGEMIETGKERYGLNWAGKADCFKIIQQPSVGTLKPCREESVNFDGTENLFIEGDNLEVLKLLQKAYYGKVKMMYFDPPYNTGNDFIYPDNYSESLDTYLKYTGQVDSEGRKYSTNTEADGRFHTKWINMMYPRLYLAKNLLMEDGVIFISIDDNEVSNLRKVCDEIFGEENFAACFVVKSNPRGSQSNSYCANVHEYVLCYLKNSSSTEALSIEMAEEMVQEYNLEDNFGKYRLMGLRMRGGAWRREERPLLYYPIFVDDSNGSVSFIRTSKDQHEVLPIKPTTGEDGTWRWSKKKSEEQKSQIVAKKVMRGDKSVWDIYQKDYLADGDSQKTTKAKTIWDDKEINYQNGTNEIKALFDGKGVFTFPKPTFLIKKLIELTDEPNALILDFFSGSATTAHAVLDLNKQDGGNRKFIMIQLPEPCTIDSEAFKAGYKTIADIGKERIRRVIKKIKENKESKLEYDDSKQDLGFKIFKLDTSNFKIWDTENSEESKKLGEQLQLHVDHIDPKSTQEDILYELLLKSGFDLATKTEKLTLAGKTVYSIADGAMLICLEEKLTKEVINAIAEMTPSRVVCLDKGFKDNDQLKTNAVQIMKSKKVNTFLTV